MKRVDTNHSTTLLCTGQLDSLHLNNNGWHTFFTFPALIYKGGFSIQEEMCVNYVLYYPKTDLEVCKSSIADRPLDNFFGLMHEWVGVLSLARIFDVHMYEFSRSSILFQSKIKLKWSRHFQPLNYFCFNWFQLNEMFYRFTRISFLKFWIDDVINSTIT